MDFIENTVKFMYGKYYDDIINNKIITIDKNEVKPNTYMKEWNAGHYYCMISDILNNNIFVENMHGHNYFNHNYISTIIQKYWKKDNKNYILKFNWHDWMMLNEFILTHNRRFNTFDQVLFPLINYTDKDSMKIDDDVEFVNKSNTIIWRGAVSGRHILNYNIRCNIVLNNFNIDKNIDIGFITSNNAPKENFQVYNDNKTLLDNYFKQILTMKDIIKHKFFLSISGQDCASSFPLALLSNCCPLHNYPFESINWIYGELEPYIHFVPIKNDGSDLLEIYNWCICNLDKCEEIANNGKIYMEKILNNYEEILKRFIELYPLVVSE
jgi:hypothetical protein